MKVTRVNVNGGASTVDIPASIPAKFVRIVEDSDMPLEAFYVKTRQSDGTFSDEVLFPAGKDITIHKRGILARPPDFVASGVPATGDPYAKIRTKSGGSVYVRVTEHEDLPEGNY